MDKLAKAKLPPVLQETEIQLVCFSQDEVRVKARCLQDHVQLLSGESGSVINEHKSEFQGVFPKQKV